MPKNNELEETFLYSHRRQIKHYMLGLD